MRKFLFLAMLVAAWLPSAAALAGPSIFAGVSVPVGEFGNSTKLGFHGGAGYAFDVSPLASLGLRAAYNRFTPEAAGLAGHLNMIEGLAVGRLTLPIGPSIIAGVGATNLKFTGAGVSRDGVTKFTTAAGVGYGVMLFEVIAMYHSVATDGGSTGYATVSAGLNF